MGFLNKVQAASIRLVHIPTEDVDKDFPKIKRITRWSKDKIENHIYDGVEVTDEGMFTGTDLVIALDGTKVIGFANAVAGYAVMKIWIEPEYRSQGIATRIYDLIEKKTHAKLKEHELASEDAILFWKNRRKRKRSK